MKKVLNNIHLKTSNLDNGQNKEYFLFFQSQEKYGVKMKLCDLQAGTLQNKEKNFLKIIVCISHFSSGN